MAHTFLRLSVLVVVVAALANLALRTLPCVDLAGTSVCAGLLDAGGCAVSPMLSKRVCGASCGWCLPATGTTTRGFRNIGKARITPTRWHQIEKIAPNTTNKYFIEHFRNKQV